MYEFLLDGVEEVCAELKVPFESARIPKFKAGLRNKEFQLADYCDSETEAILQSRYFWEIERFGYGFGLAKTVLTPR